MNHQRARTLATLCIGPLALLATAATPAALAQQAPAAPAEGRPLRLEEMPPGQRLGARAAMLREKVGVIPCVVVVPDQRSYLEAVAAWSPKARFPVLIEDGSLPATEDIARFVRAFRPDSVVRWAYKASADSWPRNAPDRRALIEQAVARSWGADPATPSAGLITLWKNAGATPPGIVIADPDDPVWTAALALSAGRAQPLAWITTRRGISQAYTPAEAESLAAEIEKAAVATGLTWRELGDEIDAVTVCTNGPSKIQMTPGEQLKVGPGVAKTDDVLATTDRLARHAGGLARWGWASQVFGSERQAAYRAMCALFLDIQRAWLFDGYPEGKPWSDWDCTQAAKLLDQAAIAAVLDDLPRGGRADWRARAGAPLDVDLALVNTRGGCMYFDLAPGTARPGDIPLLARPVVVHMVHSWSLQYPDGRSTVGGCWLERGAYAYLGSVQEPYLIAFIPTPVMAARMATGWAWAPACRRDDPVVWRIATIGDPLITRGPAVPRIPGAPLPLEGTTDLRALMADLTRKAAAAGEKDDAFGQPLRLLTMLGEDAKAAALAEAVSRDKPGQFTLDAAVASMFALARSAKHEMLGKAYEKLDDFTAKDPNLRDALWVGSIGALPSTTDKVLVRQLRRALRADQADRDAMDLAPAYARVFGKPAAVEMLTEVRAGLKDAKQQAEIDGLINAMK